MIDYPSFILFLATLVNSVLGFVVFLRNHKSLLNRLFLFFAVSVALWVFTNGLYRVVPLDYKYLAALASYGSAGMVATAFALFNLKFTQALKKKILGLILGVGLAVSAFSVIPGAISTGIDAELNIVTTDSIVVYALLLVVYFLIGLVALIRGYIIKSGVQKNQIGLIFAGLLLSVTGGVYFNLVLPVVNSNYEFVWIGPSLTLLYVGTVTYAIIKHRMFDIRLVVARSIAYLLALLTVGVLYGFTVFGFVDQFFPETQTTTLQQSIYTMLAVFLAFTFQPLKRFFDQLTDKVFYRDRYDTEEVLNRLGKTFVSKSNSFDLLDDSLNIITKTLKTDFGYLAVANEGEIYRVAHTGSAPASELTMKKLSLFKSQLSVYDELDGNSPKRAQMHDLKAQVVLRLTTRSELVGYLILSSKRSGTIFTRQDINLLEILAQELAVAIQNAKSYEEIQAFSEILRREVEDATAKLRETNKRLRKLDEAKDEFISMASHQLRTPLTTIKGYLSMLLEGDAGRIPPKQKEFIDLAFVSSQRMVHLIADMLNVSRVSTGKLTIDKTRFNLVSVVRSEIEQLRRQAEAREVELKFHAPEEAEIPVDLDEGKIRQVIMNFTDNAIYYTPKGKVDVYLEKIGDTVELKVVDKGIGVSKEAQKQLFTKFFRAENAQRIRPDGTGLGLYMAKQVIEAQDGQIIFNSTKGRGSTFGFRFNLKDQPVNQPAD